jgi:peptidoglycan hydrolase-like protein with peptidoglycan-binding domain
MKFSATLPIALAFATGLAGTAVAQAAATTAATAAPQASNSQTVTGEARPPNGAPAQASTQMPKNPQPDTGLPPANATAQQQPASGLATNGNPAVRQAQLRLHALGLYDGPTDGIMDPNTRAAIARFQQRRGMQRTESLDPQTLAALSEGQNAGYGSSNAPPAASAGIRGYAAPPGAGGNAPGRPMSR